jgi:acetate kinase
MQVLVINSGSSSVKFELFEMDPERSILAGEVERIGEAGGARDHGAALGEVLRTIEDAGPPVDAREVAAVGHRVVHGGQRYTDPIAIDDDVVAGIREAALFAPLHTAANVAGIEAAREHFPRAVHVAVFDTAFHRTIPPYAREYALPREIARANGIRRYGFHGTSHGYVAKRAASLLGRPLEELDLITLHLGNGASVCAIHGGRSADTSMGMTPLEGLVMGTRCGDVDPAVPPLLGELTGRSREDVHRLLNFESGLKGVSGESDMREVHKLAEAGDPDATLALDMYCYRARKYIGAYAAALGRLDAIVFTAGVGENDAEVRGRICAGLELFGVAIDETANAGPAEGERAISPPGAEVAVLVIPTDEEFEIARAAYAVVRADTGR